MPSERVQRRIDSLLDQADAAIDRSDWRAVQEMSAAVLSFDAENEDALALQRAAERAIAAGGGDPSVSSQSTVMEVAPSAAPSDMPASYADGRYLSSQTKCNTSLGCCHGTELHTNLH